MKEQTLIRPREGVRPTTSALVTTFNHKDYIVEALDSLLSQTHPLTEILVSDDGSSDGTPELVATFERFGVTLLTMANGGPSRAMNALLRRARGDVLLLQSGDDVSHSDRVEVQLQQLRTSDIASCIPRLIDNLGGELPSDAFPYFSDPPGVPEGLPLFSRLFYTGNFICAPTIALQRRAFEAIGFFHGGLIQLQDYHYWLRASAIGYRFDVSERAYASYRVHSTNLSRSANDRRTSVERGYVLRTAAENLNSDQLAALLYGEHLQWSCSPSAASLRALVLLRHRSPEVRKLGLELLIDELADEEARQRLTDCLGVDAPAVFSLMSAA